MKKQKKLPILKYAEGGELQLMLNEDTNVFVPRDDKAWMVQWIQNRQVTDPSMQAIYDSQKEARLRSLSNTSIEYGNPKYPTTKNITPGLKTGDAKIKIILPEDPNQYQAKQHEISHAGDMLGRGISPEEREIISKNLSLPYWARSRKEKKYWSNPTEVKARLNTLRQEFKLDPTKQYDRKNLKYSDLLKSTNPEVQEILQITTPETIYNLLNETSQVESDQNLQYAQKGGDVKYSTPEHGLTIMPNENTTTNMAKYGGYLDNIVDAPEIGGYFRLKNQMAEGGTIPPTDETTNQAKNKKSKTLPPIYVESKDDPRYRAYQDSLILYNVGNDDYKKLKNAPRVSWSKDVIENDFWSELIKTIPEKFNDAYDRLIKLNKKEPSNKSNQIPFKVGFSDMPDKVLNTYYTKYKKPVQPVKVKSKETFKSVPKEQVLPEPVIDYSVFPEQQPVFDYAEKALTTIEEPTKVISYQAAPMMIKDPTTGKLIKNPNRNPQAIDTQGNKITQKALGGYIDAPELGGYFKKREE